MQIQCWYLGVGRRLTNRQQLADLTEQVITDPGQHSFSRVPYIRRGLQGAFIPEEVLAALRKYDGLPIHRDSFPLI